MSTERLTGSPSLLPLYLRAAAGAIPSPPFGDRLPFVGRRAGDPPELTLDEVEVDRDRLARYARTCGFPLGDLLPSTYPHVVAFPLHLALLTDRRFPFNPIGLIHVGNRIVQRRPLGLEERLAVQVRATQPKPHSKGLTFSILTSVRAAAARSAAGEPAWEEEMTILRRGGGGEAGQREAAAPASQPEAAAAQSDATGSEDVAAAIEPLPDDAPATAQWRLAGDLGRRYAAISGDRNPIHIHPLTARLFGLPRPIVHGMWTKARCLAALGPQVADACAIEVAFKRPVQLPATVALATARDRDAIRFAVRDARTAARHLDGVVVPAEPRETGPRAGAA